MQDAITKFHYVLLIALLHDLMPLPVPNWPLQFCFQKVNNTKFKVQHMCILLGVWDHMSIHDLNEIDNVTPVNTSIPPTST